MSKLISLLGLLCGALAAFAGLLYNPLASSTLAMDSSAARYAWTPLEFHGSDPRAAELLGLPAASRSGAFADETLVAASASIIVLRDAGGQPAALATRLVAGTAQGNLLQGDVGARAYMTVFLPNRGSLYLAGYENRWPMVRSDLLQAVGQSGDSRWAVSVRDAGERASLIVGGSGGLAGASGSFRQSLGASADSQETITGDLQFDLSFR